jgi:hypothetical protein
LGRIGCLGLMPFNWINTAGGNAIGVISDESKRESS